MYDHRSRVAIQNLRRENAKGFFRWIRLKRSMLGTVRRKRLKDFCLKRRQSADKGSVHCFLLLSNSCQSIFAYRLVTVAQRVAVQT